jgi:hypothetical protein
MTEISVNDSKLKNNNSSVDYLNKQQITTNAMKKEISIGK